MQPTKTTHNLFPGLAVFVQTAQQNKVILTALAIIAAIGLSLTISGICAHWHYAATCSVAIGTIISLVLIYVSYRKYSEYLQRQYVLQNEPILSIAMNAPGNNTYILTPSNEPPSASRDFIHNIVQLIVLYLSGIDTLHARGVNRNWRNAASDVIIWKKKADQWQLSNSEEDLNFSIRQIIQIERFVRLLKPACKHTFRNITPRYKKVDLNGPNFFSIIYSKKLSAIIRASHDYMTIIDAKTFTSKELTDGVHVLMDHNIQYIIEDSLFKNINNSLLTIRKKLDAYRNSARDFSNSRPPYERVIAFYQNWLVVASNKTLKLLDITSKMPIKTIPLTDDIDYSHRVNFEPFGAMDQGYIACVCNKKNRAYIDVYEIETERILKSIKSPLENVIHLFIQNGWLVGAFYNEAKLNRIDGYMPVNIYVWKISDIKESSKPIVALQNVNFYWFHKIVCLQIIGNYLIYLPSQTTKGQVALDVWDLNKNELTNTFTIKTESSKSIVRPIAFAGDHLFVFVDQQLQSFEITIADD